MLGALPRRGNVNGRQVALVSVVVGLRRSIRLWLGLHLPLESGGNHVPVATRDVSGRRKGLPVSSFRSSPASFTMPVAIFNVLAFLGCLAAVPASAQGFASMAEPGADGDAFDAIELLPSANPQGPVVLDGPYVPGGYGEEVSSAPFRGAVDDLWVSRPWSWHILPGNLIWTSYLAGPKEPRFATVWYDDTAPDPFNPSVANGWLWDSTLGGRASILRYGTDTPLHPQGFEVQIEGAAFVRLDPAEDRDLRSSDFRFGIPLIYGVGRWQTKLAYYHLSAHLGDEAMVRYPDYSRVNYVRDAIVWGGSWYALDWLRLYGEVGWSFFNDGGSEPWEFQFGTELIQARPTGIHGAPFLAVNGMSRQELDWGGNVCVQTGWAWRGDRTEKLFRLGFEYLYGSDPQYEFPFANQNRAGIGMWYDF